MRNTALQQKTPGFRLFPIRCVNHGFRNATTLRCVTLGAGGSQNDAEIMDFRVTSHDPPQATVARWPAKRQSLNRFSVPLSPRARYPVTRNAISAPTEPLRAHPILARVKAKVAAPNIQRSEKARVRSPVSGIAITCLDPTQLSVGKAERRGDGGKRTGHDLDIKDGHEHSEAHRAKAQPEPQRILRRWLRRRHGGCRCRFQGRAPTSPTRPCRSTPPPR